MAEQLSLVTPIVVQSTTTDFRVASLTLEPARSRFVLVIRGTNGEQRALVREGATAMTLMSQLNTANGAVQSLQRRALAWALTQPECADLVGTITGTPD